MEGCNFCIDLCVVHSAFVCRALFSGYCICLTSSTTKNAARYKYVLHIAHCLMYRALLHVHIVHIVHLNDRRVHLAAGSPAHPLKCALSTRFAFYSTTIICCCSPLWPFSIDFSFCVPLFFHAPDTTVSVKLQQNTFQCLCQKCLSCQGQIVLSATNMVVK